MKVKRSKILELYTALMGILGDREAGMEGLPDKFSFKFTYALNKNKTNLHDEVEALQKAEKDKLEPYNKERLALCERYAEISEDGKPIKSRGEYKIAKDKFVPFEMAFNDLGEKHKAIFAEIKAMVAEEAECELYLLKMEDVPDLPAKFVTGISHLVVGAEEKK